MGGHGGAPETFPSAWNTIGPELIAAFRVHLGAVERDRPVMAAEVERLKAFVDVKP
jgi:hypothetical protein